MADTSFLWSFFITAALTVSILLLATGGAIIIGQRRLVKAHEEFTRNLVRVQDQERERIAAEVHDDIGVQISMLKSDIAAYRTEMVLPGQDTAPLVGIEEELLDLSSRVRSLAHRLHPSRVAQVGLTAALKNLAQELENDSGVSIELMLPDGPLPGPPVGYAVYRIVQEAIRNAAQHGKAGRVRVELSPLSGTLVVKIIDNGSGFDSSKREPDGSSGIGMSLMKERATVVGGSVRIDSRVGSGTTVIGTFPFMPSTHGAA